MAALTDFLEDQQLEQLLNGVAPSPTLSGTIYVGAFSGATTDAMTSGGAAQGEIAGNGYARVEVVSGFTVTAGTATNDAAITWPVATGNWGTVSGVALFDALTGGNALVHGLLDTAKAIDTNDALRLLSGTLALTFD